VDGQENPIPTIIASKFYEVQKYLILSGHVLQTNQVTISDKKLKALPADLQASLFETFEAGAKELTNVIVKAEADGIEELKKNGVEVITPDMEAFREAGKAVVAQFQDQRGEGLYEKIQAVQ
jgi:TRAP-type C4-dicarboxylate transport system substrate-binding protein